MYLPGHSDGNLKGFKVISWDDGNTFDLFRKTHANTAIAEIKNSGAILVDTKVEMEREETVEEKI